ncbi:MAG: MBL fold metallo-hydrolase [Nitrospira sp.]|nr:MBL fold metallo-hydrolase [Nitrospira sp.]
MKIPVMPLGQCGFRLALGNIVVYIDPYLTDHVAEVEGPKMRRLKPVLIEPSKVSDADYVLITHAHLDHCDLSTLIPISSASPQCRFVGPNEVTKLLIESGIAKSRVVRAAEEWIDLGPCVQVMPVPSAHPRVETDEQGYWRCVGYVVDYGGRRLYHGGDGSPDDGVLSRLKQLGPIDTAFIPVNERNFYRDKCGIVGNMSVREAFQMTADIGAKILVPTHWDMFAPNSVYKEEIDLLFKLTRPPFDMKIDPQEL